jgi:hypothetical protein
MSETQKKRGPRLEYDPRPKLAHINGIELVTSDWHKKAIVTTPDGFRLGLVCHKTPESDPRAWMWSFILGSGEPTRLAHFHLRQLVHKALNG